MPSHSAGARAFFENVQPDWGGGFVLPAGDNAIVYPDPEHDGVFESVRLEVTREAIEDYELLMESARRAPERTDALARAVMPTFTEYIHDVNQFREFERELLVLVRRRRGNDGVRDSLTRTPWPGRRNNLTSNERGALSASLRSSSHQSKSSADAFLRRMVALLITGRAQKPTLRTNPNVM